MLSTFTFEVTKFSCTAEKVVEIPKQYKVLSKLDQDSPNNLQACQYSISMIHQT